VRADELCSRWLRSAHNIEPWGKCYFPIRAMNELYADGDKPLLRPEDSKSVQSGSRGSGTDDDSDAWSWGSLP
jgi:hypothetical protein